MPGIAAAGVAIFRCSWPLPAAISLATFGTPCLGHCTTDMQADQMLAIVTRYMDQHPAEWDSAMNTIVFRAFVEACRSLGYPLFVQ